MNHFPISRIYLKRVAFLILVLFLTVASWSSHTLAEPAKESAEQEQVAGSRASSRIELCYFLSVRVFYILL